MTFSFDPSLANPKDQVRQKIGDTKDAGHQIEDETITALLLTRTVISAARELCLNLAAIWARVGTVTLDDQQQRGEDISEHYLKLAAQLAKEEGTSSPGSSSTGAIIVGGIGDYRGPIDPWPRWPCW